MQKLFFLILINSVFAVSQTFKGKITSDSIPVHRAEIYNSSTKTTAYSDAKGNFSIEAKENDVLKIGKTNFVLVVIKIKSSDFEKEYQINLLKENIKIKGVVVKKTSIIPKGYDMNKILDKYYLPDQYSTVSNGNIHQQNMGNILGLLEFVFKLFGKDQRKEQKDKIEALKVFKENKILDLDVFVYKHYTKENLSKILNLPLEKVEDFIVFCKYDNNHKPILNQQSPFEVLEFLQLKVKDFQY